MAQKPKPKPNIADFMHNTKSGKADPTDKPNIADFIHNTKSGKADKSTLSAARRKAIAKMNDAKKPTKGKLPEDTGNVDSPLGVRGSSSSKKYPNLRVN